MRQYSQREFVICLLHDLGLSAGFQPKKSDVSRFAEEYVNRMHQFLAHACERAALD